MQIDTVGMLRREFAGRTDRAAYHRFQLQRREENERRERKEDADKDASDVIDVVLALASTDAIQSLRIDIDAYDTATIIALQENDQRLTEVRAELDEMLSEAYVLSDGRRAFKTEDGLRVFDEHGNELPPELIDPTEIADHLPRWERFKLRLDQFKALQEERSDLLEYQDKLDAARERLDQGDLTQNEFNSLRQDLVNEMPEAVRRQIPELTNEELEAKQRAAATKTDLGITDDMVATTAGPLAPSLSG